MAVDCGSGSQIPQGSHRLLHKSQLSLVVRHIMNELKHFFQVIFEYLQTKTNSIVPEQQSGEQGIDNLPKPRAKYKKQKL